MIGSILFSGLTLALLLALQWGGSRYHWNSSVIIGLFCSSGAIFLVFIAWEHRLGKDALIPYPMIRKRVVWSSCFMTWALCGSIMVSSYYLPLYFQAVRGVSPTKSGVYVLPTLLSQLLTNALAGWASKSPSFSDMQAIQYSENIPLINTRSRQVRLLSAMGCSKRHTSLSIHGTHLHIQTEHHRCRMDHVPSHWRHRPGRRAPVSKSYTVCPSTSGSTYKQTHIETGLHCYSEFPPNASDQYRVGYSNARPELGRSSFSFLRANSIL